MAVQVASLEAVLNLNKKKFDDGLKKSSASLNKFAQTAGTAAIGGVAALGGAMVGVGAAAFDMSRDTDKALGDLAANLGISKAEAEGFEDVITGVFSSNFGDDVGQVADAVGQVTKQLGRLDDKDLQRVTEGVFAVSDAFDKDFAEVLDAQKVLMEEFGLTSTEALDFVSKGFQKGLDRSGDFTDSIREYGNLFGDAGSDASQFFSILETGAEGGVLGTDKIADAFKELNIRLNEGSAEVSEALTAALGQDRVLEMAKSIKAGEAQWGDFFGEISQGLAGMEDEWQRNRAQVALFGTMAEDLGPDFTSSLSTVSTTMEDIRGATDALGPRFDDLGSKFEGIKRQALVALQPLGDIIALNLGAALDQAAPFITGFAETLGSELAPTLSEANAEFMAMLNSLGLVGEETSSLEFILGAVQVALDGVVGAMKIANAQTATLKTTFTELGNVLSGEGVDFANVKALGKQWEEALPDWMIPGSPTPLEVGLRGISDAMNSISVPNMAAAGGNSTSILNMNGQSFNFAGQNSKDDALMAAFQILRAQLEQA